MSLLASRVDYCNAVLYGTPAGCSSAVVICRLQNVLTAAARLAVGFGSLNEHIRHWLPVPYRIQFKIAADF